MIHTIPGCEYLKKSDMNEWIVADDSKELINQDFIEVVLQPANNATENSNEDDIDDVLSILD